MSAKKLANLKTLFNSKLINFKTKRSFFLPLANRSHISAEGCNQKRQRRSDTYFCAWPRTHSNVSLAADHCSANGNILTDFLCTRSPAHIVMQRRPLLKDWVHRLYSLSSRTSEMGLIKNHFTSLSPACDWFITFDNWPVGFSDC